MRSTLNKRLVDMEARLKPTVRGPVVWVQPGQSFDEAKAERGLGHDDPCHFLTWQPVQDAPEAGNA